MNNFNFRPDPIGLPPVNIEVEEAVLGSILLDPSAIYRVAEILTAEAFYVDAHKDIYQACLSLYKQKQSTDLLSVINWLADKGMLIAIGGRNKLASLVERCVSSVNVDGLSDLLVEKFIRRQIVSLSYEVQQLAHSGDTPLSWLLDKIEQKTLLLTQLRKHDDKGYWNKRDAIVFEQVCKDLEEAEEIENSAQRDWVMKKLAKKWKFSNKKELLDFHAKWLDSQNETCTYTADEYFQKYGNLEQNWLIPGFIAANSVITLYAQGGVGKTRLAFTLAKHAVSGGTFAYEGTDFEPINTLIIETDQGPLNTSKLLEMHNFLEPEVKDRLRICDKWHFGEFGKLKAMLKKHQPKLVILDSLTSLSVNSIYSENDTEYARPLVRLRHLASEYNCTFLVIHHCNASGGMRGTRAIQNTVDEVFKFSLKQNELGSFNVLTLEKTRSRAPGSYKFTYDEESWGWKFGGRLEDDILGGNQASTSLMTRCLQFLQRHKGTCYETEELAEILDANKESIRRDLKRASLEGLVNCGRSTRNIRALVYYLGAKTQMLSDITSDPKEEIEGLTPDHFFSPEKERENQASTPQLLSNITSDQVISPIIPLNIVKPIEVIDHLLIFPEESPPPLDTTEEKEEIKGETPDRINPDNLAKIEKSSLTFVTNVESEKTSDTPEAEKNTVTNSTVENLCPRTGLPLPSAFEVSIDSPLGTSTAAVTFTKVQKNNRVAFRVDFTFANGITTIKYGSTGRGKIEVEEVVKKEINARVLEAIKHPSRRYRVMQIVGTMLEPEVVWIEGCECFKVPEHPANSWYVFKTPTGERIQVAGDNEFKLEK